MPALLPVALSPGASFTLVMNGALAGGYKGLFRTLAGTALGIYTHAVLIGLGITAVIISSPATFAVLKVFGTAYLLWLGAMLIRSGIRSNASGLAVTKHSVTLREAWIANILNPKAIIFYLTVVSQFAGRRLQLSDIGNSTCRGHERLACRCQSDTYIFSKKNKSINAQKIRQHCRRGVAHCFYSAQPDPVTHHL